MALDKAGCQAELGTRFGKDLPARCAWGYFEQGFESTAWPAANPLRPNNYHNKLSPGTINF